MHFDVQIVSEIRYHLQLHVKVKDLMQGGKYPTPERLIDAMSTYSYRLKLFKTQLGHMKKYEKDEKYKLLKKKAKFDIDFDDIIIDTVQNYIYNIPSDYFRLINPKKWL